MDKRNLLSVQSVTLADGTIAPVKIYEKKAGRHISARAAYGELEIYAFRRTPQILLRKFIQESLKAYEGYLLNRPFYKEGVYIYCLGRKCLLTDDVKKKNDPMYFYVPKGTKDPLNRYKKLFQSYVNQRVPELARAIGLNVDGFKFRTGLYISYFGCCFPETRQIKFDYRLFAYSPELIDCIFYHELTHLMEIHHNKRFYELLNDCCTHYEMKEKMIQRGYFEGSLAYAF